MPRYIAAAFEASGQAEAVIDELWHEGFPHERVGIAVPGNQAIEAETPMGQLEKSGAKGAVVGSVVGGTLGTVAGALVATLVPGIGTVLTGGLLVGVVTGTAAGAALGAYLGPFIALEMSDKDKRFWAAHLKQGRSVVVVKTESEEEVEKAREILHNHGGQDVTLAPSDIAF